MFLQAAGGVVDCGMSKTLLTDVDLAVADTIRRMRENLHRTIAEILDAHIEKHHSHRTEFLQRAIRVSLDVESWEHWRPRELESYRRRRPRPKPTEQRPRPVLEGEQAAPAQPEPFSGRPPTSEGGEV